jgi:hypothetical protein
MLFTNLLKRVFRKENKVLGRWQLESCDKKINSKDFSKGMEMLYDMTICPLFQGFFNHIFDVYKKRNKNIQLYTINQSPTLRRHKTTIQ